MPFPNNEKGINNESCNPKQELYALNKKYAEYALQL